MTTTAQIVTRAFRKIGVAAEGEPLNADQLAAGVDALNAMMHGWALVGIDLEHVDLAPGDEFSMAAKFHEGAVYQLARRLSPDYASATPDDDAWFRALQVAYLVVPTSTVDPILNQTPAQRRLYRGVI